MEYSYVNLYNTLGGSNSPFLPSVDCLCEKIETVNEQFVLNPNVVGAKIVLDFLTQYGKTLQTVFSSSYWGYLSPLHIAIGELTHALKNAVSKKQCDMNTVKLWGNFYHRISSSSCAILPDGSRGTKYVIRQMPNTRPYNGHMACIPTQTPASVTERNYGSYDMCQMALQQLYPVDEVPVLGTVLTNEYGTYQERYGPGVYPLNNLGNTGPVFGGEYFI